MKKLLVYCMLLSFIMNTFSMHLKFKIEKTEYSNGSNIIFDKIYSDLDVSFVMRAYKDDSGCCVEACVGGYNRLILKGAEAKNVWEIFQEDYQAQSENNSDLASCDNERIEHY